MRKDYIKINDLDIHISDGNYSSKYPSVSEFVDEGIPFIRANNLISGEVCDNDMYHITEDKHRILLKGHVKENDILITTRGNVGQVAIVPKRHEDSNINAQIVLLRPDSNKINSRYLLWVLQSQDAQRQYDRLQTGTALKQLPVGKLKDLAIRVYPLEEQKKIASKLDKCYEIIRLRKRLLTDYDQLIKSRFVEMFGDPIKNDEKWETRKLNEVCPVNRYKGQVESTNGQVWLLNLDMIESNTGKIHNYVLEDESKISSSIIKFDTNCVLYSKLRPYLNKVVIPTRSGYATSEMIAMQTNIVDKYFLSNLLRMKSFVDFANGTSYGAKMPRASVDMIKNFDLIFPPKELQNNFAQFAQQVDKTKLAIQKSIDETQKLFDSLMQEYFG